MKKKIQNSNDDTKKRRVTTKDVHEKLVEMCQNIDNDNSNINDKLQFISEDLMNLNFNLNETKNKNRSLFKKLSSRYDLKMIFAAILSLSMAFFGATWLLANL